jgi:hypothetical protein
MRLLLAAGVALPLLLAAADAPAGGVRGARRADPAGPDLAPRRPGHDGETRCELCHTPDGWDRATFAHDRTGFPLEGRHGETSCRSCHSDGTFTSAVPRACAACHRDVHRGRLGQRCERCHDAASWAATTFGPDAHRRTAFPLTGRHAAIPCESCHGDARDRGFSRPVRDCLGCHEDDLLRAQASAALPHDPSLASCRPCHGTYRFMPAAFPAHEDCFAIRSGDHAGVRCRDCHTSIPPVVEPLACTSGTFDCRRCHSCAEVTGEHDDVPGFDCTAPRKCYECHRFSDAGDELRQGVFR